MLVTTSTSKSSTENAIKVNPTATTAIALHTSEKYASVGEKALNALPNRDVQYFLNLRREIVLNNYSLYS